MFQRKKLPDQCKFDSQNDSSITDVIDGEIYKKFRQSVNNSKKTFTFTISTDGISLCEKSSLTIWPVFLVVNEIPIEERYYWENVLIAGKNILLDYSLIKNN